MSGLDKHTLFEGIDADLSRNGRHIDATEGQIDTAGIEVTVGDEILELKHLELNEWPSRTTCGGE
jgi:hypothetical protein